MSEKRPPTVSATPEAVALIERLQREHGELLFHASGGCCDGTAPMCYKLGELSTLHDVQIGEIAGVPYFLTPHAWNLSHGLGFVIDVQPGEGTTFSLDQGTGQTFCIRQCLLPDAAQA